MRILIFTEGTIIIHKNAVGHTREEIVNQVEENEKSVYDYKSYIPIGNAVKNCIIGKMMVQKFCI